MAEADERGDDVTAETVAPGLVMEARHTTEPDGRYLIYYKFRRQAEEPTMVAVTLSVPEIVCAACAGSIRQALAPLPGVGAVDVDIAAKQVAVRYDPRQTNEQAVRAAIEQAGFDVA